MTATLPPDLEDVEKTAAAHLAAEEGHVEAGVDAAAATAGELTFADEEERGLEARYSIAVALSIIATAIMAGGVFSGASARVYAAVAGLLGLGLAVATNRMRRPVQAYAVMIVGLFVIGLLMVVPSGFNNVTSAGRLASDAAKSGNVLRPPVKLTPGWEAIIGWLMGVVGFGAGWVAVALRRAPLALLAPLPIAAICGISVPKTAQVASGIIVLILFAIGLGILSTANTGDVEGARPPIGYEIRRGLRALPLLAVITVGLYGLSRAHVLFPRPVIDPTQKPQKPRTVPLSAVKDRVLFEVQSAASGPWRIGSLDVYDGQTWRLPPFGQNKLKDVPNSGVVNASLSPGVRADFTIVGLEGAVLPALPNTVGVVAKGPRLAYDARNGNLRVAQGQVQAGLQYTVVSATLPTEDDLRAITRPIPANVQQFTKVPSPPAAVVNLINQAPKANKWDEFNFLRNWVLDNVTASGVGRPVDVPPSRVEDMLAGSKTGSPFEIVAAQALLARWAGLPSRLGYGFDGGDPVGGRLQVHPRDGATFVEVYFPGYEWLPVIGVPKKAKPTVGQNGGQQENPNIVASNDIGISLFVPVLTPPASVFTKQLQRIVLIALPLIALLLLLYFLWPAVQKSFARSRRRTAAQNAGARARIALAYAEWRDLATDYGYRYSTDTPLMFLDRFADDPEHTELAWLVTRALWGDLQDRLSPDLVSAAEELSRSLRRRLALAHPATVRFVAAVSRLSRQDPWAPQLDKDLKQERAHTEASVAYA